jgi:hypothetical protein
VNGAAVAVLLLLVLVWATVAWCVWTATRLDRLHLLLEASRAGLRELLQQRAGVAIELASTGLEDPASAVLLMDAAVAARDSDDDGPAQSRLTQVVQLLDLPSSDPLVVRMSTLERQASMARRIHNDIAARTIDLRGRRRVRWFRLAGRAPVPEMVEFDDATLD